MGTNRTTRSTHNKYKLYTRNEKKHVFLNRKRKLRFFISKLAAELFKTKLFAVLWKKKTKLRVSEEEKCGADAFFRLKSTALQRRRLSGERSWMNSWRASESFCSFELFAFRIVVFFKINIQVEWVVNFL